MHKSYIYAGKKYYIFDRKDSNLQYKN